APAALDAVLTVCPVDLDAVPAALTMQVIDDPAAVPQPVAEFAATMSDHGLADCEIGQLERQAFYARARNDFAIVRNGELRAYGNILLVKGVVNSYER